jgi:hypothetical protein
MAGFGVTNGRKFRVLAWKTLIVKARHYIETGLDLIIPSLLFIILAVVRYQGGESLVPTEEPGKIFDTQVTLRRLCSLGWSYQWGQNSTLLYAPENNVTNDLMAILHQSTNFFKSNICYDNEFLSKYFANIYINIFLQD